VLQSLADKVSPRILSAPPPGRGHRETRRVLSRPAHTFGLPLDWRPVGRVPADGTRPPARDRLRPHGSYAAVAQLSGSPKAVRAVGTPCATTAAGRGALPPRDPRRRQHGGLPRRPGAKRTLLTWRRQQHEYQPDHPGPGRDVGRPRRSHRLGRGPGRPGRYGCALTGPLLTSGEAAAIAALYPDGTRFRSTVNMARHRFGEVSTATSPTVPRGGHRAQAGLYPGLLPIARDWWSRLGRPAPWRSAWTTGWRRARRRADQIHGDPAALPGGGLERPAPGPVRRPGVPAEVVINLSHPGTDHTGGEFLLYEQRPRASPAAPPPSSARARPGVHHPRPPGAVPAGLVGGAGPARRVRDPFRRAVHPGPRLPRRGLIAGRSLMAGAA